MYIQTTNYSYKPKTDVFSTFKNEPKIRNCVVPRTYRYHNVEKAENKVKFAAAAGAIAGALVPAILFARKQKTNLFKIEYGMKEMLGVSSGAIVGGTAAGIIADKKKNVKHKVKEGIFQFFGYLNFISCHFSFLHILRAPGPRFFRTYWSRPFNPLIFLMADADRASSDLPAAPVFESILCLLIVAGI